MLLLQEKIIIKTYINGHLDTSRFDLPFDSAYDGSSYETDIYQIENILDLVDHTSYFNGNIKSVLEF